MGSVMVGNGYAATYQQDPRPSYREQRNDVFNERVSPLQGINAVECDHLLQQKAHVFDGQRIATGCRCAVASQGHAISFPHRKPFVTRRTGSRNGGSQSSVRQDPCEQDL
jgi:hypothetical protein